MNFMYMFFLFAVETIVFISSSTEKAMSRSNFKALKSIHESWANT